LSKRCRRVRELDVYCVWRVVFGSKGRGVRLVVLLAVADVTIA
jgi:hypothetical protein